jgi:hypothetical protein
MADSLLLFGRTRSCHHLHPYDLKQLNLKTTKYFIKRYDYSSAMKVGAFLAAMKRGAVVVFHANPGKLLGSREAVPTIFNCTL